MSRLSTLSDDSFPERHRMRYTEEEDGYILGHAGYSRWGVIGKELERTAGAVYRRFLDLGGQDYFDQMYWNAPRVGEALGVDSRAVSRMSDDEFFGRPFYFPTPQTGGCLTESPHILVPRERVYAVVSDPLNVYRWPDVAHEDLREHYEWAWLDHPCYFTSELASRRLLVSVDTVLRWLRKGHLRGFYTPRYGGGWMWLIPIPVVDLFQGLYLAKVTLSVIGRQVQDLDIEMFDSEWAVEWRDPYSRDWDGKLVKIRSVREIK